MVVRAASLEATMSRYLVDRIEARPHRGAASQTEVVAAHGDGHLESLTLGTGRGARDEVPASWLFVFIGASPHTDWLGGEVARDAQGFVVTGPEASEAAPPWESW